MIPRLQQRHRLTQLLERFPVVGLIGARQVGKTTLARSFAEGFPGQAHVFDLEDPKDLSQLDEPMFALRRLRGLVVIDEVQHRPELFRQLRVLADRPERPARFLVLGSASPELLRQSSESLAGRIAYHELGGLDLREVGPRAFEMLWIRGGFPRSFAAASLEESSEWRRELIRTYLERDLSGFGLRLGASTMRQFWTMLAHYHGQIWNGSELARAFGVTEKTVRRYLGILCATFMARRLDPWHENLAKRQVRAPKVYLSDTGLLHTLLGVESPEDLRAHPKVGASFEGFAIDQVIRRLGARPEECHFWALHTGAELDLLIVRGRRRLGFEIKRSESPRVTRSMRSAVENLGLDRLDVVHAGDESYPLAERVRAVALVRLIEDLEPL